MTLYMHLSHIAQLDRALAYSANSNSTFKVLSLKPKVRKFQIYQVSKCKGVKYEPEKRWLFGNVLKKLCVPFYMPELFRLPYMGAL